VIGDPDVVVSLNVTVRGLTPVVGVAENETIGTGGLTFTNVFCVLVLRPPPFVAFKRIDQFPTVRVVIRFLDVPIDTHVLLPVTLFTPYSQLVGEPVEVSLSNITTGEYPEVTLLVKLATGGVI
jgi:hypothetical protein